MDKMAVIFPGQGAQFSGMGRELFESSPEGRKIFEEADRILGVKLTEVCFQGPEATLTQTSWCQPGIMVHGLAALAALRKARPDFTFQATAGLSLGEFTALTAAGRMTFEDGIRIVRRRGELMQLACEQTQGAMAAIMGMEADPLRAICQEAGVDLANLNCPGQIVISGEKASIEKAMILAKEKGAKRAMPLAVAGAYHSRLMKSAADQLQTALSHLPISPSSIPVLSNVTAQPHGSEDGDVKDILVRQVTSSVRWEESMRYLLAQGFKRFLELGPGKPWPA